jgi:nitrogen regulatory protein PII
MHFKLIIAFINDEDTDKVLDAARDAGATGATVINHARGEGIKKKTTFFGMNLDVQVDVVLFVVEEHLARHILETIDKVAGLDSKSGKGMAIQIDIEDAIGIQHQMHELEEIVKGQL